jgi:hypothetical protein
VLPQRGDRVGQLLLLNVSKDALPQQCN